MRDYAHMPARRLRTANYPAGARARLGDAVAKAREAAGHKYRTTFARDADITSLRSLELLEAGKPGVGQSILFAVGRFLPNWTEDTPRQILEGGPIPPTGPVVHEGTPRTKWERRFAQTHPNETRDGLAEIFRYRRAWVERYGGGPDDDIEPGTPDVTHSTG